MTTKSQISERPDLEPAMIYDTYYEDSGLDRELVIELLEHVADELQLPVNKLRPDDRFSVELTPSKLREWDSGYGVLVLEVLHLAKEKGVLIDRPVESVDDYIRTMAQIY